ncbi:MoaD family protein [Nitrosomonas sp. Is37]|uniref:MoaD family protein n=1 Tax=Nitrosomonas sp. Is37 TaxID=3080535 RepID=UPI00294AD3F8|nr:MoaD family protein [Nitrosomonas sp. Is37]MDV6343409.1 MoaD family protein [Nitrosomonas sp. Is37]
MSITVSVPTILRPLTQNQKMIEIEGSNVLEIIEHIEQQYPGFKEKLISNGKEHHFINIYVNDEDIRFGDGLSTKLKDGDTLTILPAVAGGQEKINC